MMKRKRPMSIARPPAVAQNLPLTVMPAKALPLLPVCERVAYRISEKPCGPALSDGVRSPPGMTAAIAARPERRDAEVQDREHRQLHLSALDLLAQVLGRAADHQPGDEHREDGEHQHAQDADADAAEDDLAERDVEHRHAAGQRREAVVHGVDRAGRGVGGDGGPQRGRADAEADLLALLLPPACVERGRLVGSGPGQDRVAGLLAPEHDAHAQDHEHHGGREERPALPLVAGEPAERVGEAPPGWRGSPASR